VPEYVKDQYQY